jgi:hypothetical protein
MWLSGLLGQSKCFQFITVQQSFQKHLIVPPLGYWRSKCDQCYYAGRMGKAPACQCHSCTVTAVLAGTHSGGGSGEATELVLWPGFVLVLEPSCPGQSWCHPEFCGCKASCGLVLWVLFSLKNKLDIQVCVLENFNFISCLSIGVYWIAHSKRFSCDLPKHG